MASRIETAFDQHFYRTPTEPSGTEIFLSNEIDWERKGDPVAYVIEERAEVEPAPAEDIRKVLEDRHFDSELAQMGEEGPFDPDAHYGEAGVEDAESQAGWLSFERSLKTEARYFSRTAEWKLSDIFGGIADHRTHDGRPIVVDAGPGLPIAALYRARVFQSDEKLEETLKRPDREVDSPPWKVASAGRMNPHGVSVFYGATDPSIALAEVRPPVHSRVVVGRFDLISPVRLLDVEALRSLNVEGSIFDRTYIQRLERAQFLKWLSRRITRPVMPDDEPFDYLATQAVADFLASNPNPLLHGILYPSVQGSEGKLNVVLFHKAARVQPLDLPKGTTISASLYDHTEDGLEVNYWVSEDAPPPSRPTTVETDDFPFLSEPLNEFVPDYDQRAPTLKLDVSSLEVRHVRGVVFETESYPVHRHRFEKQEPKF